MAETQIEWTDATWNPVAGCSIVSVGCTNCYAMEAKRLEAMQVEKYKGLTRRSGERTIWNGVVREDPAALDIPLRWKKPKKIFVNSMSDLFHERVSDAFILDVWKVMRVTPHHHYQILTKRAERMTWSFELPVKLKCAIADCITVYSNIESCIVELVWTLEQADLERKKEIAKAWGDQNFRIVKKAIKSIPGAESDEIWPALKDLQQERNLIGHGVWMIASDGRPRVVWHAKFLESVTGWGANILTGPASTTFSPVGACC
jgi:Protein of unknown function (DUF5131)